MDKIEVLNKLESNKFESYFVGGYVRDYLLEIETKDIDITTSATPDEIRSSLSIDTKDNYGCILLEDTTNNESIEITSYRLESSYENRHPSTTYTKSLIDDLKRRDFTINAICMDKNNNIVDPLNGVEDLENKLIRCIGDIETKLTEDPLRILRAIRFASTYNFNLEESLSTFIKEHSNLVKTLSYDRRIQELNKMFKHSTRCLDLLKEHNLLDPLEISFDRVVKTSLNGIWAQLSYSDSYTFDNTTKKIIEEIRILTKENITKESLLKYQKESIYDASLILGLPKNDIDKLYESLPIKDERELKISGADIEKTIGQKGPIIKEIKKDLIKEILSGNLPNREDYLIKYIIEKWK